MNSMGKQPAGCHLTKEVFPPEVENNIAITVASSDAYAKYLFVLLASIQANATEQNHYDLIVLSDGISVSNRTALAKELVRSNISIRFVDADGWLDNRKLHTARHISRTTYLRLAALDILSHYDKVIYLDCDIVVNRDLGELYAQCVDGYMLAAAADTVMRGWCCMQNEEGARQRRYNAEVLGVSDSSQYFNAGVMVLNLAEFRKRGFTSQELIRMASETQWKWFDQDLLNKLCHGSVTYLDPRWNVMVHPFEFEREMAEYYMPQPEYADYWKAVLDPYVVHYAGHSLPVFEPTVERCDLFWRYARKTSRYGQLQNDMRCEIVQHYQKRSFPRKIADIILPYGSRRRAVLRSITMKK